jgi:hypothetical protein
MYDQDVPRLERMYQDASLATGLNSDRREEDGPDASVGSLDPDRIVGNLGNWRQDRPQPTCETPSPGGDLNQDVPRLERIYRDSLTRLMQSGTSADITSRCRKFKPGSRLRLWAGGTGDVQKGGSHFKREEGISKWENYKNAFFTLVDRHDLEQDGPRFTSWL